MSAKRVERFAALAILGVAAWVWFLTPEVQEVSFPLRISASQDEVTQGELLARWLEESGKSVRVDMTTFEQMPFNATLVLPGRNPPEGFWMDFVYVGDPFGPDYRLFWTNETKNVAFQNVMFFQKITWSLEDRSVVARSTRTTEGNAGFAALSLFIACITGLLVYLILHPYPGGNKR